MKSSVAPCRLRSYTGKRPTEAPTTPKPHQNHTAISPVVSYTGIDGIASHPQPDGRYLTPTLAVIPDPVRDLGQSLARG